MLLKFLLKKIHQEMISNSLTKTVFLHASENGVMHLHELRQEINNY